MERQYRLRQINPPIREEFLRGGAIYTTWQAYSMEQAVNGLKEAMESEVDLPPEKLVMRRQFLALAIKFHSEQRDRQLYRALESLKLWDAFKRGELDEGTIVTVPEDPWWVDPGDIAEEAPTGALPVHGGDESQVEAARPADEPSASGGRVEP